MEKLFAEKVVQLAGVGPQSETKSESIEKYLVSDPVKFLCAVFRRREPRNGWWPV